MTFKLGLKDFPNFSNKGAPPCSETFPDAFFSEEAPDTSKSSRGTYKYEYEAKTICNSCPYVLECLQYALTDTDIVGIWGGTNEYERRAMVNGRIMGLARRRMPSKRHR